MVSSPGMGGAVRRLDDVELAALEARCNARLAELQNRGVQAAGMAEHYIQELLTQLLDHEGLAEARERHFYWLEEQLDEAEAAIRRQILSAGNGR